MIALWPAAAADKWVSSCCCSVTVALGLVSGQLLQCWQPLHTCGAPGRCSTLVRVGLHSMRTSNNARTCMPRGKGEHPQESTAGLRTPWKSSQATAAHVSALPMMSAPSRSSGSVSVSLNSGTYSDRCSSAAPPPGTMPSCSERRSQDVKSSCCRYHGTIGRVLAQEGTLLVD